jgi:hypothetical protein
LFISDQYSLSIYKTRVICIYGTIRFNHVVIIESVASRAERRESCPMPRQPLHCLYQSDKGISMSSATIVFLVAVYGALMVGLGWAFDKYPEWVIAAIVVVSLLVGSGGGPT